MHTFPLDGTLAINHLAACFNNTSATYKFYWLLAILDAVQHNGKETGRLELFTGMMAKAWYTANYFHVSFG